MASKEIADGQITASSEYNSDWNAAKARLDNEHVAWSSAVLDQHQWIQVSDKANSIYFYFLSSCFWATGKKKSPPESS